MIAGVGEALLPVLTPASTNPANEIARELTGRDYISWSALSTFRTCPLKYKFRYIDGLPEESVSSALVFGTGIHTAVEQHYQALLAGDPKPDLDALLFAYRSAWLPHDPDAIQFGSTETRTSLDALAARMLAAFLSSPAASVRGRVLGVEEEIRGMLVEGVPDLYGRVDLLTEDADSLVITDIKTSRSRWSPEQVEDSGEQLLLYSHLASEISPGKKVAKSLRRHRHLILNWFRAIGTISSGVVEGLNGVVKLTTRKAFGFRTAKGIEIALFHVLGRLPEPESTHRFC